MRSATGMQHMLAIMKAETGRFVNIVDGCEPDDFYRRLHSGRAPRMCFCFMQ